MQTMINTQKQEQLTAAKQEQEYRLAQENNDDVSSNKVPTNDSEYTQPDPHQTPTVTSNPKAYTQYPP